MMTKATDHIFLSYRRNDSADVIGRIYDRLTQTYGDPAIFKDVDSIPLGIDFRTHLDKKVSACRVFIAVIGPQWVSITDAEGNRRLVQPHDFVRIEVESALAREIPVIPLLVSGAVMPTAAQLPPSLQALAYRNGALVRPDPDFHNDMDRVIAGLANYVRPPLISAQPDLAPLPVPSPPAPPSPAGGINIQAGGAIGTISGIVGGNVSGIVNLGTLSGDVTNTINQLPDTTDTDAPSLKDLLTQLQTLITAEASLAEEDRAEALIQIKLLATAGQKPDAVPKQKVTKTALKILRGTVADLPASAASTSEIQRLLMLIRDRC